MMVTVPRLFNVHAHFRECVSRIFALLIKLAYEGGASSILPMPNTNAGLCLPADVLDYCKTADNQAKNHGLDMKFVRTMMVTENTSLETWIEAVSSGIVHAKIYPKDRTTKSGNGVRDYFKVLDIVRQLDWETQGKIFLHFHPEHPWLLVGNRDAEYMFIPIVDMFIRQTNCKIVWEHGTDARCISSWKEMAQTGRFFVTLTAHHLVAYEDVVFGDVRAVCKPPIKTRRDRDDLIRLILENHPWVLAGGDDAPHNINSKHTDEGCCACGAYTAPFLLPLYAHALDELLTSDGGEVIFVNFTSRNAVKAYGEEYQPSGRVTLERKPFKIPLQYKVGSWTVMPFMAGQEIKWRIAATTN